MGSQGAGSEADLGDARYLFIRDLHLGREGQGARMEQGKTNTAGSCEVHFPHEHILVGTSLLYNPCCLLSRQGLSVPRRACFWLRLHSAAEFYSGEAEVACRLSSHSRKSLLERVVHLHVHHAITLRVRVRN